MADDTGGFTRINAGAGANQSLDDGGFKRTQAPDNRSAFDKLTGTGGPRYQTWPERMARGVYGDIRSAVQAAEQAPIGHAEQMAPQVFEAAKDVVPISPASRLARAIPLTARPSPAAVPTQQELLSVYKPIQEGALKIELAPHVLPTLKTQVDKALREGNQRDYLAPKTFRVVEELIAPKGQKPNVMDVEGVRRLLGNVPREEYKAAGIVRDIIDDYLAELPDKDVIGGSKVGEILANVRANYSAGKRSELITGALEKGEQRAASTGSGANLDNALRQNVRRIIENPKLLRGVPKNIQDEMRSVVKGGSITNLARLVSKLGPKHPVSGWFTALLADLQGGAGLGLATMGAGAIGQKVAEKATLGKIQKIDEALRKQSPMYRERATAADPAVPRKTANVSSVPVRGVEGYIAERREREEREKMARALAKARGQQ